MQVGVVSQAQLVTPVVVRYEVDPADRTPFASWPAGAHIDVGNDEGLVRQYSLLPAPSGRVSFAIKAGDGGSGSRMVRSLAVGTRVQLNPPRSTLGLEEAPRYRFIAAGIGVTPLVSMVTRLVEKRPEISWSFVHVERTAEDAAFFGQMGTLAKASAGQALVWPTAQRGRPSADDLLADGTETLTYACGPARFLEDVAAAMAERGEGHLLRTEARLTTTVGDSTPGVGSVLVELRRTGRTIRAQAGEPLLAALEREGVRVPTSCRRGICGTCETTVIEGSAIHRDQVLSDDEKEEGGTVFPCVSGGLGGRLVLDL